MKQRYYVKNTLKKVIREILSEMSCYYSYLMFILQRRAVA